MLIRNATVQLRALSRYSSSRPLLSDRAKSEKGNDFEERVWRERLHINQDGHAFIPPMSFKKAIATAAKHLSIRIEGEGAAKYTKFFESAVFVTNGIVYSRDPETIEGEWLFCDAQPQKRNGGKVWRKYPYIDMWEGTVDVVVAAEQIPEDIFAEVLAYSGHCIGVGRWRPENKGTNGRYAVDKIDWK